MDELVMMPSGDDAATTRARAMASLAGAIHEKATSVSLGELLERVEEEGIEEGRDAANARARARRLTRRRRSRRRWRGERLRWGLVGIKCG